MRLLSAASTLLALVVCASAQYFSQGWQPGQPVARDAHPTGTVDINPASAPTSEGDGSSRFDFTSLLTSGPVGFLAGKMGVNMTEKLQQAKAEEDIWDPRIPLITDSNYEEIVVNEPLSPEEEKDRVWFIIISVSKGGKNAFSMKADEHFDNAYNQSIIEGDLSNVRWGRIDYLNVTYITTKWSIWQAPYLVVLTDRGQTLRFYKANSVRLDPTTIREFLRNEGWREGEPWGGPFAPGGRWEYILHYFALSAKWVYEFLIMFPKWVLMIASAGIANLVMKYMHTAAGTGKPQANAKKPAPIAPSSPVTTTVIPNKANPTSPKSRTKQRKNAIK
ncbi:uncharacterized protein LAESUDRAFT_813372 [Laetiporus sulphureus 93-53]|uniref:Uncharacterized protein n=1 Tax=Laetiporus sulphureus 93-53 TaxID=1314785 RepID=A0A165DSS2_9APHY|nr:uncharacterized protein LAESUDRAFT_813372 [Laetiporus sulphureus 93-53]KZT05557.1 hypothetical protein LAESUDRAFT_813372 [Laetiporus sulphureus 93-53]